MKRYFTLLIILFISSQVFSQEKGICGNVPTEQELNSLLASKLLVDKSQVSQTEEIHYVPVKFHLIADNDGNGRGKEVDCLQQLAVLNQDYANTNLRFYIKDGEFEHYNSDNIFTKAKDNTLAQNQMTAHRDLHAVDVFVVDKIGSGAGGIGTILGFYKPPFLPDHPNDWIIILKSEVRSETNTLSHELGHFFSLAHTFSGWEGNPFQPSSAGWPTAPGQSPGGPFTERQNGTNCNDAADRVCDTPPDYNFGLVWNSCDYTGGAKDPQGTIVDPMENNQMSYFSNCYPYIFTQGQIDLIHADYSKSTRDYLKSNHVPNMTSPTEKAVLVYPEDQATNVGNVGVTLQWKAVPGAEYYVVELSRTFTFSLENQTFVTQGTSFELPTLEENKSYFWKITPFTEGGTDVKALTSSYRKFKSSPLAISKIEEINAWDVTPNPTNSDVKIAIRMDKPVSLTAQLIATNGQVLQSEQFHTVAGEQVLRMPQMTLSNGTYFLRLTSKNGVETRRVVVQK